MAKIAIVDDDIFFTVSNDNGQTFVDPPTDLSNNDGNSDRYADDCPIIVNTTK